jgi:16S rRNA (guanine527-N7)-methyltransferase
MELGSQAWQDLIVQGAKSFSLQMGPQIVGQYAEFAKMLVQWNEKINLTAITDPRDMAIKHFIDSLAVAPFVPTCGSVLDMGTGAGFPGIPLKILYPHVRMTLIDAVLKKVNFIKYAIRTLKLMDAEALHIRAEHLAHEDDHKRFDLITCRAFSSLEHFVMLAHPLLAEGGLLLALKGRFADKEPLPQMDSKASAVKLATIGHYPFKVSLTHYQLPFSNAARTIICLQSI